MAVKGRNYQLKTEWNDILACFDKESKKKKPASLQFSGYYSAGQYTAIYKRSLFCFYNTRLWFMNYDLSNCETDSCGYFYEESQNNWKMVSITFACDSLHIHPNIPSLKEEGVSADDTLLKGNAPAASPAFCWAKGKYK